MENPLEDSKKYIHNSFVKSFTISYPLLEDIALGLLFFSVALLFFPPFIVKINAQFTLPKLAALRVCTLLLVLLWICRFKRGEIKAIPKFVFYTGIVLGVWWIFTTFFALHKPTALNGVYNRYSGLWNHEICLLLFFVAASMPLDTKRIERVLHLFITALIPVSLFAVLQYYHIKLYKLPVESYSTLGNPEPLASLLSLALPFIITFLFQKDSIKKRFYWGIVFLVFTIAILSTSSRGPWIGIIISSAIVIALNIKNRKIGFRKVIVFSFLFLLLIFMLSSLNPGGVKGPSLRSAKEDGPIGGSKIFRVFDPRLGVKRFGEIANRLKNIADPHPQRSLGVRYVWYKTAVNVIKDHPIVGVGFDNFRIIYPEYKLPEHNKSFVAGDVTPINVHNRYLQAALTGGIPGLIIYLTLLTSILVLLFRTYKKSSDSPQSEIRNPQLKYLSIAFISTIICYLIQDMTGWSWSYIALTPFLWIMFGLAVSFCETHGQKIYITNRKRLVVYIVMALCSVALVFLIVEAINNIRADRLFKKAESLDIEKKWTEIELNISKGLRIVKNDFHYEDKAGILYIKRLGETMDIEAYEKGSAVLEKAHIHNPFDPYVLIHGIGIETLALKRDIIKKPSEFVEKAVSKLIKMDKYNPTVYIIIAELKVAEKKFLEARDYFEKAKDFNLSRHYNFYILQGDISQGLKNSDAAIEAYRKAIKKLGNTSPSHQWILIKHKLVDSLTAENNYGSALKEIKSVTDRFPSHTHSYMIMGNIYLLMNDTQKARESFAIALKTDPSKILIKENLAPISPPER